MDLGELAYSNTSLKFYITRVDPHARIYLNNALILGDGSELIQTINLEQGSHNIEIKSSTEIAQNEYAPDYKSDTYTFTYERKAPSEVAELEELKVVVNNVDLLAGIFESKTINYENLRVDRLYSQVNIQAVAKENGTITGTGLKA